MPSCIALSIMDSKYIQCAGAIHKDVWLGRFLQKLVTAPRATDPVVIRSDSIYAFAYVKGLKYHGTLNT